MSLRCVENHTTKVYDNFTENVAELNKYFEDNNNTPPLTTQEPPYAGSALWAKGMRRRVSAARDWFRTASRNSTGVERTPRPPHRRTAFLVVPAVNGSTTLGVMK